MNSIVSTYSSSEQIKTEIQERMGICPSFFLLAEHSPEIMGSLWQQAQVAYLDNPLPSMFKEKLFTYASRFCSSPYCLARHSAFLMGRDRISGDPDCPPIGGDEVAELISRPLLTGKELEARIVSLNDIEGPIAEVPIGSPLERTLIDCSAVLFVNEFRRSGTLYTDSQIKSCRIALGRVLGIELFQNLVAFLSFIRTAHFWTEMHAELQFDDDVANLLNANPQLSRQIGSYSSRVENEFDNESRSSLDKAQKANLHLRNEIALQIHNAERLARESESRMRTLFESGPECVKILDCQNRLVDMNSAGLAMIGVTSVDSIAGKSVLPMILPEHRDNFVAAGKRVFQGEHAFLEYEIQGLSGRKIRVESYVSPIRNDEGEVESQIAVTRDITEQVQTQEQLRAQAKLTRDLLDTTLDGYVRADSNGVILDVNRAYCEMLGYDRTELVAMNIRDIEATLKPEEVSKRIERMLVAGRDRFESRHRHANGSLVDLDVSIVVLDRDSESPTVSAFVRDITAQKKSQAAIEESEARFRAIFEQAAVGVALIETQTGLFLQVNRRFSEIAGYSIDELTGSHFHVITYPDDFQENLDHLNRLRQGIVREYSMEKRYVRKDGTITWVALTVSPLWKPGEAPDFHIAVVEDISLRVSAMESLQAKKTQLHELNRDLEKRIAARTSELVDKNQELEAFAHTVSHDLRAPLRAMEGFASALSEDFSEQLGHTGLEFVGHIRESARHMDHMVNDLLTYSRLGRDGLNFGSIDLGFVVRQALEQYKSDINDRRALIEIDDELHSVVGHRSTLVQIVANLIQNALKFVPPGTKPGIRIWSEIRNGERVRLWVKDNGIGISPDYQQRIFRVFERLHGIESYPGTGIGLAIVARGCERLGGQCGVESDEENGSAFWIEFPMGESA